MLSQAIAKVMQCTDYSKIRLNLAFVSLSLKFIKGHKAVPVFRADRLISGYPAVEVIPPEFGRYNVISLA